MIEVTSLRKTYGRVRAVEGVSFTVHPHETFGLLGPNGAGKTTTLHMIVGLLRQDSGQIRIAETGDPGQPAVRRVMGIATQSLALYDDLTATENLRFFARLYGLGGRGLRQSVDAGLARAGLEDRSHQRVKTFSGGMKRRLHLACALVHDPQVLLLDEPTIGVDAQARRHILDDIHQLKAQGRTILFTTHYMEEAEQLCDRVAIMDHGRILAMDRLTEIVARYGGTHTVRAELTGTAPAGALPGVVQDGVLSFESDEPFEALAGLAAAGIGFRNLMIERPNLETAFLKLTGRSLRDG